LIRKLTSKKGISPILATLLLIAIAVAAAIISYAWIITFVSTQTQQSGAVLVLENTRFYAVGSTKNRTDITIRNTGTSSAKIVSVYWSDSSFSALAKLIRDENIYEYTLDPLTGMVNAESSITITVKWGVSGGIITGNWTSGELYYFKTVTRAGQYLEFTAKAP
jgi:flagellin-like protein